MRFSTEARFNSLRTLSLILILNREAARNAVHLVSGLDLSDLGDLGRRGGLGIDIGAGTGEASQRAFGSGVLDSLLLHQAAHQFYRFLVDDDGKEYQRLIEIYEEILCFYFSRGFDPLCFTGMPGSGEKESRSEQTGP